MDLKRVQGEREGSTGLEQGASASACWGSGTKPGMGGEGAECDACVLGLRLHGVSMCLHEPGLEILLEGARFQRRKRTTAGFSTGAR